MSMMLKDIPGEETSKYQIAKVNAPGEVLLLLTENFGFAFLGKTGGSKNGNEGLITKDNYGHLLLLIQRENTIPISDENKELVLINTPDLLKSFNQLRSTGRQVKIEQVPKYTAIGIELIFSDPHGNRFLLMEKRDYLQFE